MAADEGAGQAARPSADATVMPGGAPSLAREEISVLLVEDDEGDARLVERSVLEQVHRDVRGQVVHPVERLAQGECVRLGRGHADQ